MAQYRTTYSKRIYDVLRGSSIGDYRIETIVITYFKGKNLYILIISVFPLKSSNIYSYFSAGKLKT